MKGPSGYDMDAKRVALACGRNEELESLGYATEERDETYAKDIGQELAWEARLEGAHVA